jgi:hypothetical protein
MIYTRLLAALRRLTRPVALAAVACAAMAGASVTTPAVAWWAGGLGGYRGGVFIGIPPIVVAPPIYPPAYYPPPPAYYPPPQGYYPSQQPPMAQGGPEGGPQGGAQSCYAGPYVCPMDHPVASGSGCYCLGNNRTQVWGRAS